MKRIILVFSLAFFQNCVTFQIPPISVTGTKTASEKQIIGDQKELEKDVWMISSAKTTSKVDTKIMEKSAEETAPETNSLVFKGLAILDTFNSEFNDLKRDRVVGENSDGLVSILLNENSIEHSPEIIKKYSQDEQGSSFNVLKETVKQINLARNYIIEGYIQEQKTINPQFNPDKNELLKVQKDKYRATLQKGEYFQNDEGAWEQVK